MKGDNSLTDEQYRETLKDYENELSELKEQIKGLKEENVRLRKILYEIHSKVSPFD